jgi:hypothetical protein
LIHTMSTLMLPFPLSPANSPIDQRQLKVPYQSEPTPLRNHPTASTPRSFPALPLLPHDTRTGNPGCTVSSRQHLTPRISPSAILQSRS